MSHSDVRQRLNSWDLLVAGAVAVAFWPVFYRLATMGWEMADYAHAYFLLPIFGWLVYRKKDLLARSSSGDLAGGILFSAGIAAYIFSCLNGFFFLQALSFVFVVWGIFFLRFTASSVRALRFPLLYLLLLVPPPFLFIDTITMPLKNIATAGSYSLLKLAQLPVRLKGAILTVGQYDFFVAEACSGYRSMVALIALGSLYAYLQPVTRMKKWVIFLSVIPLGIAGNIFRIFVTGVLGHTVGVRYAEGFFHEFSGAVVFLIAILGLILISRKLSE